MDEPKRVVVEHFPVERLPEDVRDHFSGEQEVVLSVESRGTPAPRRTISEILDAMQNERVLSDDPVVRIRALRAGWDHRDELIARIRRGEMN
jgi:hypothetical protein